MNRTIKDALFGVIGGITGTAVIIQVMGALSKLQSKEDKQKEKDLLPEQPTEKLARQISEDVLGIDLNKEQKMRMGRLIQWGYGALWGGVYGLLRKRAPSMARAGGLPFGVAFGLVGPAIMLPTLGLTPPATRLHVSVHIRGLVSHYAYAATLDGVCRLCEGIEKALTRAEPRTNPELRRVS